MEVSVKGGGPGSEGRIEGSNGVCEKFRGGGGGSGNEGGDGRNEDSALLGTPILNLCVYLTDSLIEKGFTVNPGIEHGGKGSRSGQAGWCGELCRLDAAEAMGVCDGAVVVRFGEEIQDPARGFGNAGGETAFEDGEIMEGVRGLEVRGGQLCVVKAFVDHSKKFKGKLQPGLLQKDGVRSVEWGGEGLTGVAKAVKCDAGSVGVWDGIMVEGVGDDDGGGFGVANEVGTKILEG